MDLFEKHVRICTYIQTQADFLHLVIIRVDVVTVTYPLAAPGVGW